MRNITSIKSGIGVPESLMPGTAANEMREAGKMPQKLPEAMLVRLFESLSGSRADAQAVLAGNPESLKEK